MLSLLTFRPHGFHSSLRDRGHDSSQRTRDKWKSYILTRSARHSISPDQSNRALLWTRCFLSLSLVLSIRLRVSWFSRGYPNVYGCRRRGYVLNRWRWRTNEEKRDLYFRSIEHERDGMSWNAKRWWKVVEERSKRGLGQVFSRVVRQTHLPTTIAAGCAGFLSWDERIRSISAGRPVITRECEKGGPDLRRSRKLLKMYGRNWTRLTALRF